VYDNTPLHWALPHATIAELLLENGGEVNSKSDTGQTPLIWAAQDGQEDALRLLLQNKADVKIQDRYGFTALHAAALKGHEAIAQVLLENGADPEQKDHDGWTPLHAAALNQHEGVVRLLLAEICAGEQILNWTTSQQKDIRMRASLAELAEKKSGGSTVVSGLRSAAQDGHFERVQALLESGAAIDEADACGSTALTIATI
jgi:ankyrin repeat protein